LILAESLDEPVRLDGPAAAAWDELAVPLTDDALVDRVATRTGTPAAEVRGDVLASRRAFAAIGAITEVR
jgi:hypothetical protein